MAASQYAAWPSGQQMEQMAEPITVGEVGDSQQAMAKGHAPWLVLNAASQATSRSTRGITALVNIE